MQSVVSIRPATEATFCSAVRARQGHTADELGHALEYRQQVADVGDLGVQQHVGILRQGDLLVQIVDGIGREIAAADLTQLNAPLT